METEFPLTAVINVMSHWGEIKKKQLGKGRKIKIKYYLAVKDALELGKGGVWRVTVSQCLAGVDGGHRDTTPITGGRNKPRICPSLESPRSTEGVLALKAERSSQPGHKHPEKSNQLLAWTHLTAQ